MREHRAQTIVREHRRAERLSRPVLVRIGWHPQQRTHPRAHRREPAARALPHLLGLGAAHQPRVECAGVFRSREEFDRIQQRAVPRLLGIDQDVGEHFAREQFAGAVLHRLRAGRQVGFLGKVGEQPLRKRVDRVDPQPAARAIEHPGEQGTGALASFDRGIRTERLEFAEELGVFQPHPARQHRIDPRRHFRRARLGEGEAQDFGWIHTGTQQHAQHARRQHLRLAGPGAGGQPDVVLRVGGEQLLVLERIDLASAAHPPAPSPACASATDHSSSRISWS